MRTLALILGLLLNFALYIAGAAIGGWHSLQTMAALAVFNFIAILFHELGHAWAYIHVGGRVHQIAVLFLLYDADKGQLGRSRRSIGGDVGGYVAGSFGADGATVRNRILVSAAGPAANLITGAVAALIAWAWVEPQLAFAMAPAGLPNPDQVSISLAAVDRYIHALWWWRQGQGGLVLFAVLSIGLAILNLIPYGGSDGQQIARALKMHRMQRGR